MARTAVVAGTASAVVGGVSSNRAARAEQQRAQVDAQVAAALPAFWLLVPGATGLIGVTQIAGNGHDVASRGLSDVLVTIISISLGVLIGAAALQTADAGLRRLSQALPPT